MSAREEIDRLRAELEEYRQRELRSLGAQFAEAKALAEHYRSEAQRNADIGRQIAAEAERERTMLKAQIEARESSARPVRPTFGGTRSG